MASTTETRKSKHAMIRENAVSAFKDHKIQCLLDNGLYRHWRCGRDKSSVYQFHIVTFPGRLIVAGDVGFLALEREPDMLPWCRGSLESTSYFAEKVPRSIQTEEWSDDVARAWVLEEREDDPESMTAALVANLLNALEMGEAEFKTTLADSDLLHGCDWPRFTDYTSEFLWCREAVRWFLANLPTATPPG